MKYYQIVRIKRYSNVLCSGLFSSFERAKKVAKENGFKRFIIVEVML